MPKMTQFCRHKIVIWTNKVIPKKLVIKNSAYLGTVSKVSLKKMEEIGQVAQIKTVS